MRKFKNSTIFLTRTAVIAALYAVITLAAYPISFGPVQFRISEALTILPLFYLEAVPGLFIGCFLANIASGPWDMLIGSVSTLIAAVLTYLFKRIVLGTVPPVVINAFTVPLIFMLCGDFSVAYMINVLTVGLGQLVSVVVLGVPLYNALKTVIMKRPVLKPTNKGFIRLEEKRIIKRIEKAAKKTENSSALVNG